MECHQGSTAGIPKVLLESQKLVQDEHDELSEVKHVPGAINICTVAWTFTLRKPEYPLGRRGVVIANDITHKISSFGPAEDEFFRKVMPYARAQGLPCIYLCADSGSRVGLTRESVDLFYIV